MLGVVPPTEKALLAVLPADKPRGVVLHAYWVLDVFLSAEKGGSSASTWNTRDSSACREALVVVLPAHGVLGVVMPAKKCSGGGGVLPACGVLGIFLVQRRHGESSACT
jgi:hypothetical protein